MVVLEKTLESPLDHKEINPVNPQGNQLWIFIGRTDVEAETPILWPADAKSWIVGKDPNAGKDWRQEEEGMTEDEVIGWHHWLKGHEFEQAPGVGEGQGSLAYCSPWGHKESDMTSDWTELTTLRSCLSRLSPTRSKELQTKAWGGGGRYNRHRVPEIVNVSKANTMCYSNLNPQNTWLTFSV